MHTNGTVIWEHREIVVKGNQAFWHEDGNSFEVKALAPVAPKGILGFGQAFSSTAPLLSELGQQGWELVAVNSVAGAKSDYSLFLKRPRP